MLSAVVRRFGHLFVASVLVVGLSVVPWGGVPVAEAAQAAGTFVGLAPARVLDTREGVGAVKGPVAALGSIDLSVTGRGGVPSSGVAAVVLNVTVTEAKAGGYISVFPAGGKVPNVSNLNFDAGGTVANLVTVKVGADGMVSLRNGSPNGSVALIADVAGYYLAGNPSVAGAFQSLDPVRVLDTRAGNGAVKGPVGSLRSVDLQVTGRGGVPSSGVSAVVLNVTVTVARAGGFISVFPAGDAVPHVSNLNFNAGQTVPNLVTVKVGVDGKVILRNGSPWGSVALVADVAGYYLAGTPTEAGAFVALPPVRVLDTREGNGAAKQIVGASKSISLQIAGRGGVPTSGVGAVVANVTATGGTSGGFVSVYPTGSSKPNVSNLNYGKGETIPNLAAAKLGAGGKINLLNGSPAGAVHLIADVAGYFNGNTPPAPPNEPVVNGALQGKLSGAWSHMCAVTSDGGLKCWGDNQYGQLGDGTKTNQSAPTNVSGLGSGFRPSPPVTTSPVP